VNFQVVTGQEAGVGSDESDAELIRLSVDSPAAFTSLFERHFDAVFGYLARRVGADAGSELASEVFARAFAGRAKYDLERPDATPWLYGIAANLLRRRYRNETRQLRAYARAGIDPVAVPDRPSLPDAELASALAVMKPSDRETLLLFAWADLDYQQIAEALGVPVGTVRSRLNRARRQLRAALNDDPVTRPEEAVDG
jgi:RNA polymerase sigma-70 factor (ECF subfamily)